MLTRLEQVCLAQETTEGTAISDASLYAVGNAAYSVINPEANFDLQLTERDIKRDTLTMLRSLTGRKFGSVKFSLEMAPHTSTSAPEIALPLKACGFRQASLIRGRNATDGNGLSIASGTTIFKHGETITGANGATGIVVGDTYSGQPYIYVTKDDGAGNGTAFTTDEWTGGTSGAKVTPGAVATSAGYGWWPTSFSVTTLTLGAALSANVAVGDVLKGATSGAIAIAMVAGTSGSTTTLYVRRLMGHFSGTEAISNITAANTALASNTITEAQLHIPSLSIGGLFDGVREAISGARGTVSFDFRNGEPVKCNFDFRGAKKSFSDGGLLSGVSYTQDLPDVWLDADTNVALDATATYAAETSVCLSQATFDMACDVQFRLCSDDPTGQHETIITGRRPTFNIDPEYLPETHFAWLSAFADNTNFRQRTRLGSPATAGSYIRTEKFFLISAPGCAITQMTPGDRDGIKVRNVTGMLTSGSPSSTSTVQRDNEFVIIYNNGAS